MSGRRIIDLTNKSFGRWFVIGFNGFVTKTGSSNSKRTTWLCKCSCGTIKAVNSAQLIEGSSKSCGCLRRELSIVSRLLPKGLAARNALLSSYKASASKRGINWNLDKHKFDLLIKCNCFYCGDEPLNVFRSRNGICTYNGIDRVDNTEGYTDSNVVTCCRKCNIAKNTMTQVEFLSLVEKIYSRHVKINYEISTAA